MNWSSLRPNDRKASLFSGRPPRVKRAPQSKSRRPVKAVKMPDWEDAKGNPRPSWRIPASKEAYDQLVERMAKGIHARFRAKYKGQPWGRYNVWQKDMYRDDARATLSSIGINPIKP